MRGQWLGTYDGNTAGEIMLNVDEVEDHFEGVAYLHPSDKRIPGTVAHFSTPSKGVKHSVSAETYPIDPRTGFQGRWEEIAPLYPDTVHGSRADGHITVDGDNLAIEGKTDLGFEFSASLSRPPQHSQSKITGKEMSWEEFKTYAGAISKSGYLFRGQQQPWPLCTSFHRRGRYRISEFTSKDVRQLHQRLSGITNHYFDLTIPEQNGAFFNLLQHHGYPTPLLDWTHSPYVAAFFAFRDRPIGFKGKGPVRIYIFNNREWQKKFPQVQSLDPAFPHLSVSEFIAIDNPRLVPQQAATTVTNIHDVEAYLLQKQEEISETLIEAIDIPAKEREIAMTDLRFMGITAGSMFPSIDGICEELRERNFDK